MVSQVPSQLSSTADWRGRVRRRGAYTSPKTNKRLEFMFENVSRIIPLRRAVFQFPGVNDAYVQDNGFGARSYPLACYFTGSAYDKYATEFEAALCEPGVGKLEHPLYGTFNVIPTGSVERRDDLATAGNQAVVVVEFMTSTGAVYPSRKGDAKNEIQAAVDRLASVVAANNGITVATSVQKASLKSRVRKLLRQAQAWHDTATGAVSAVNSEFADIASIVNESLDLLVGDPLLLTRQLINLTTAPGRAAGGLLSRIDDYLDFARGLVASAKTAAGQAVPGLPASSYASVRSAITRRNDFRVSDVMAMAAVGGAASASLTGTFRTRPEALNAALTISTMQDEIQAWRETAFEDVDLVDDGASYQAMQALVGSVASYLIEASFSLVPERAVVLDRPRTIVDLSAELYGSVAPERLDFLINTNGLSGDEIIEIPRGRRVVYYV